MPPPDHGPSSLERERERLAALLRYDILDTPREADFDDIVAIASEVCGAPIALVSLVDADRQWFKARHGVGLSATPLDGAFCPHSFPDKELLVVPDATRDPRFRDSPLVTGPLGIRFYAGAPLVTPDGFALGTVCVIDTKPRELTEAQARTLRALARQVITLLELRRALRRGHAHEAKLAEAQALQQVLINELAHRTKNNLAMVQAIVGQTLRGAGSVVEVRAAIAARLRALGGAMDALVQTSWTGADLGDLARGILPLCDPGLLGRVALEGPALKLGARATLALTLAFHELATNAMKYGALSVPEGRVSLSWECLEGAGPSRLRLRWAEAGGPAVRRPGRTGFGTRLIRDNLAGATEGAVTLDYRPEGFAFTLEAPLEALERGEKLAV
ncbi:sensor histidine kinase [Muricoccus aerilatus]|uniref:sensor histidine kinase n=1 Tax=Muricoccus aerilatus TaxID=452982 RepID=UPI000694A3EB|nr:HWE histidine kinase domain-containing protein [Roseomonas aerilata]